MSSIQNNIFKTKKKHLVRNKNAEGIAKIIYDITSNSSSSLTLQKIKLWHSYLFEHSNKINAEKWRNSEDKMQIISGNLGRETIHFEAPPAQEVKPEMQKFGDWLLKFKADSVK